jgi:hypothetical protein
VKSKTRWTKIQTVQFFSSFHRPIFCRLIKVAEEDFYRNDYPDTESSDGQEGSTEADSDDYAKADAKFRRRRGLSAQADDYDDDDDYP